MHLTLLPSLSLFALLASATPLAISERRTAYPYFKTGNMSWWFPPQRGNCQMNPQRARDVLTAAIDEAGKHHPTDALPVPAYKGANDQGVSLKLAQLQGDVQYGQLADAMTWLRDSVLLKPDAGSTTVKCLHGSIRDHDVYWTVTLNLSP